MQKSQQLLDNLKSIRVHLIVLLMLAYIDSTSNRYIDYLIFIFLNDHQILKENPF
jgi:hypothetical protein